MTPRFVAPRDLVFGALLLVGLFASGCARNGVLEIDVSIDDIGYSSDDALLFLSAQVRPEGAAGETDFSGDFDGAAAVQAVALSPSAGDTALRFDIDAGDPGATPYLALRVLVCSSASCAAESVVGEAWFELEQPFYVGESTSMSLRLPSIPRCRTCDDACDVGGTEICDAGRCVPSDGSATCLPLLVTSSDENPLDCGISSERAAVLGETGAERVAWSCDFIGKCAIRGCVDTGELEYYCAAADGGPHFCER